jgi:hypothetical protein
MLFSIGLVSTFITGGLTGIILGDSTLDINVHDTYCCSSLSPGDGYIFMECLLESTTGSLKCLVEC